MFVKLSKNESINISACRQITIREFDRKNKRWDIWFHLATVGTGIKSVFRFGNFENEHSAQNILEMIYQAYKDGDKVVDLPDVSGGTFVESLTDEEAVGRLTP